MLFNNLFVYLFLQSQYEKHKEVSTSQGVKILGKDLEKALAGLPLLVAHKEDEIPVLRVRSRWERREREESAACVSFVDECDMALSAD